MIGTSAGGIQALTTLVRGLPADFPAPLAVVMHTSPESPGILQDLLARVGHLPVVAPQANEHLRPGTIYVAPPDLHLLVEPGRLLLTREPREHRFRPAIDPLFRSAAQVYGPAAIGVILTGNLDDGVAGLWAIKRLGGIAIVQDPADALFPALPQHAVDHVSVDYLVPLRELSLLLVQLTAKPVSERRPIVVPEHVDIEVNIAKEQNPMDAGLERIGLPSSFACPECHGVLLQLKEGDHVRFRCHTGHAYSVESLLAAINDGIEDSVWNAVRALEEGTLLLSRIADHFTRNHQEEDAASVTEHARHVHRQSDVIRQIISTLSAWDPRTASEPSPVKSPGR